MSSIRSRSTSCSKGLDRFFPDWKFVVVTIVEGPAHQNIPRGMNYRFLPYSYTYAFHDANGETLGLSQTKWLAEFGAFAKKHGITLNNKNDLELLWDACAALAQRPRVDTQVLNLGAGRWFITAKSWDGEGYEVITNSEGRVCRFIMKSPENVKEKPAFP